MRTLIGCLLVVVFAGPAHASREQIHPWQAAKIAVSTNLFGDVEVHATADAKGTVYTRSRWS